MCMYRHVYTGYIIVAQIISILTSTFSHTTCAGVPRAHNIRNLFYWSCMCCNSNWRLMVTKMNERGETKEARQTEREVKQFCVGSYRRVRGRDEEVSTIHSIILLVI